jgi:hypothetical protein
MKGEYLKLLKEFNTEMIDNRTTVDPKGKETTDSEKISKVIIQLQKQQGSAATKYATILQDIVTKRKELEELEKATKEEAREWTESFFEAADRVWTRVLKTASIVVTLSKQTERTTTSVDLDALYNKLNELGPELQAQMKKIVDECVTVKKSIIASSIKVEANVAKEGVGDMVKSASAQLVAFAKMIKDAAKKMGQETLKATEASMKKVDDKIKAIESLVGEAK